MASDKLIQLIEYIGADYAAAVDKGTIISAGEYGEMQEFSNLILAEADQHQMTALQPLATELQQLIANKADVAEVSSLTATMRKTVLAGMPQLPLPKQVPDLARGQQLFNDNCVACHGQTGHGDGLAGAQMDPAPTNFHEVERYSSRSLFGLFNTITLGVADTGMVAFSQLDEQSRWDLAFYVGHLASTTLSTSEAPQALVHPSQIKQLLTATPADLTLQYQQGGTALMALFRQQPALFYQASTTSPWAVAVNNLQLAKQLLPTNAVASYDLTVAAYLDGFELVESQLDAVDRQQRNALEQAMMQIRAAVKNEPTAPATAAAIEQVVTALQQAEQMLANTQLSAQSIWLLSLLILLREGLEALLVVAAIYAVAVKTGRTELKKTVHTGWIAALALGAITWFAASYLINISGATRELTEGYTALIAAAMLFYMGFWMHSKTSAGEWQRFIQSKVQTAVQGSTQWALAVVVFLAVYREVFETILFYQSLWLQGGALHQTAFIGGILCGLLLLAVVAIGILKYAVKLPLKTFFGGTALLMLLLAIVMTGKGIAALQEAGQLTAIALPVPAFSWLGFYPTLQGAVAQGILLLLALTFLWSARRK